MVFFTATGFLAEVVFFALGVLGCVKGETHDVDTKNAATVVVQIPWQVQPWGSQQAWPPPWVQEVPQAWQPRVPSVRLKEVVVRVNCYSTVYTQTYLGGHGLFGRHRLFSRHGLFGRCRLFGRHRFHGFGCHLQVHNEVRTFLCSAPYRQHTFLTGVAFLTGLTVFLGVTCVQANVPCITQTRPSRQYPHIP